MTDNTANPSETIDRLSAYLNGAKASDLKIEPLSGGTRNATYLLRGDGWNRVLRLSRSSPEENGSYEHEFNNMKIAVAAGLAPHVYFADPVNGTMILDFIDGTVMNARSLREKVNAIASAQLVRELHTLDGFQGNYDIFKIIRKNIDKIQQSEIELTPKHTQAIDLLEKTQTVLSDNAVPNSATHNDIFSGNFVSFRNKMYLIDWECAALAEPHWEVAALCAQVGLSNAVRREYLTTYFGTDDHPAMCRIPLFEGACRLYWWTEAMCRSLDKSDDQSWKEDEKDWWGWYNETTDNKAFIETLNIAENYRWRPEHEISKFHKPA